MKMRALGLGCLGAILVAMPAAADSPGKSVQNLKGSVSYQKPNKTAKPIASQASIVLADKDLTITGLASEAAVTLPDSSRVLVGSDSKVQLAFFDRKDIASASFVIYQGKFRFTVEHPAGARADYTFKTPTGNVAVRGTQGDIGVDEDGTLHVNVYEVGNPDLPVEVTTKDGKVWDVNVGQGFVGRYVDGVVSAKVDDLKQQLVDEFSPDFGIPTGWDDLLRKICQREYDAEPTPPGVNVPFVGYQSVPKPKPPGCEKVL